MPMLTQQEFELHLWGAADILRGTVDVDHAKLQDTAIAAAATA